MPHSGWKNQRANVPSKRNTGYRNDDAGVVHDETERRKEESVAASVQQPSGAVGGAPSAPLKKPDAPPVVAPETRDWHKLAHYVRVGHDHDASDLETDQAPGYAIAGKASSIADGYAKAAAIAARDGHRCALYIEGSGGPWKESLFLSSPGVDVVGDATYPPVIAGNSVVDPRVLDLHVRNVQFRSLNAQEALRLPPSPLNYPAVPSGGIHFWDCLFSGERMAMYAQRPFFAVGSKFWLTQEFDPASVVFGRELAPLICEMDQPQTFFTFLRNCGFYAYAKQTPPDPTRGMMSAPAGYAIRASARMDAPNNGPWQQQMYSADGVLRTSVNVDTGVGAVASGIILDHCDIQGSLLCEGWYVSHKFCLCRGGIPFPERSGNVYAILRGHDWVLSVAERQFAMVQFDHSDAEAVLIAQSQDDPLPHPPRFPGGTAVWFRSSDHLSVSPANVGTAHHARGSGIDHFLTTRSSTPGTWTNGSLTSVDGENCGADLLWHPLAV